MAFSALYLYVDPLIKWIGATLPHTHGESVGKPKLGNSENRLQSVDVVLCHGQKMKSAQYNYSFINTTIFYSALKVCSTGEGFECNGSCIDFSLCPSFLQTLSGSRGFSLRKGEFCVSASEHNVLLCFTCKHTDSHSKAAV